MNEFSFELPTLVTATIAMSLSAVIAMLALAWLKPSGHRIYRYVWFAVLINGIMLARFSVDLPVLNEESSTSLASLLGATDVTLQTSSFLNSDGNAVVSPIENPLETGAGTGETVANENFNNKLPATPIASQPNRIPAANPVHWSMVVAAIWVTGVLISIAWLLFQYFSFLRMAKKATAAPKIWQHHCDDTCRDAGLPRPLPLLVHDNLGPALYLTFGGYRIVVPETLWSKMSSGQRTAIIRHEVEHCRRSDVFTSLFAFLVASIHWFNPFAWMAVQQLNQAAEWACDDAAVTNKNQQSVFARALLSISTSNSKHLIGVHGMGNSNLKRRVQRLLTHQQSSSHGGKIALSLLTALILMSGWINLRLIADATVVAATSAISSFQDEDLEDKIQQLTSNLDESNKATKTFKQVASSPAGLIVIGSQVENIASGMREEAAKDIVPEFIKEVVDDDFRKSFAQEVQVASRDAAEVSALLDKLKGQINGDSDADKLLSRFLANDNAGQVLYFSELREQMNPGRNVVMEHLGRVLADNGSGKYIVRESAKAPLMQKLKRFENADEHLQFLKSELKLLSDELVEKDELHRKLKTRLAESRGAVFVLSMAMEGDDPIDNRVQEYLENMEAFFEDEPEGLVVNEEAREHLKEGMANMDRLVKAMEILQDPIMKIVESIDNTKSDSEKSIQKFLMSNVGVAYLASQLPMETNDIDSLEDHLKSELLQELDSGGYMVREDRREEVGDFIKELLRGTRRLRRQIRVVDSRIANIPPEQIRDLTKSTLHKLVLVEKVAEYLRSQRFDAWPVWLEEHFQMENGKYALREESQNMVNQLIEESTGIQEQLDNDDF